VQAEVPKLAAKYGGTGRAETATPMHPFNTFQIPPDDFEVHEYRTDKDVVARKCFGRREADATGATVQDDPG
jgi:hypothetical protein